MKKLKVLLIVGIVVAFVLTGCGAKNSLGGNSNSGVTEDDNKGNNENNDTGNDATDESVAIFEKFLTGETTAVANAGVAGLTQDKEYSINDMASAFIMVVGIDYRLDVLNKIQYGIIDAGSDGETELALKFVYTNNDGSDSAEVMSILKNVDGKLHVLLRTDSYYRTESTIYENGVIVYGGSNSAYEYSMEYRYLDKDGNVNYVAGLDTVYGLKKCIIPAGYLADMIAGSDTPTVPELCDGDENAPSYMMYMIKTAPYDYDNYDSEDFYNYSKEHLYYVFSDMDGEVFYEADDDYASYYVNKSVNVVSVDKAPTFLDELFAKYGLDSKCTQESIVTWKNL